MLLYLFLQVKSKRQLPACNSENNQMPPSDMISSVSISIPLQTLAHVADNHPAEEAILEHESGWNAINRNNSRKHWTAA